MSRLTKAPIEIECECCRRWRSCHMYTTQMGTAAWICKECRGGDDT